MSTIEYTETIIIGKIPIGRRISEIMQEKGNAFSIRAFAERLGVNRETFRLTLTGDRPITLSLIEKIAYSLGVTEGRLRQLDTFKKEEELVSLLKTNKRTKVMLIRAHTLALELVEVALGATERGFAYNNLGRVQFLLHEHEEAHETWKKALAFAKTMGKAFDDTRLLKIVSENLILTSVSQRDYGGAEEMLQLVEKSSADDPNALGMVAFARMVMSSERRKLDHSKKYAYLSLEHFNNTNDKKQIGHALINVAKIEYLLGNYEESAKVLRSALNVINDFEDILVLAVKNYVRSLIKLHDYNEAIRIVDQYESITKEYLEYWQKMQIMYTVLKDDPKYAEQVSADIHATAAVRALACKCLFEFFAKHGDSESALRYYELERKYSRDNSDFLDKEGF
ncbi:hypothetical protein [Tumebacillus lipolyticus]|uniref:HTH cro/C1-type domain-containing protein n=1 Tax=Tumebacillus lipolyticus TaxID=1280370 RepID=A0ABW4ZYX7_9BACL